MTYLLDDIKKKTKLPQKAQFVIPPSEARADLAVPAFDFNPNKIADKLKKAKHPLIADVRVVGKYVNIDFDNGKLSAFVLKNILKQGVRYGFNNNGKNKKVLIEYSSPNIAKPLHIGHLRNTVLGMALKNIYSANGYKVLTENWLGDWGKQYGLLILAYKKWGNDEKFKKSPTNHLLKLYVRITKLAEKNKKLDEEAKSIFKKLESGDKDLMRLWKKFRQASIRDFKKTYKKLGAEFDYWNGEFFYTEFMEKIVKKAIRKGVAKKEVEGPVVVNLEKYGLRSYLLTKSDGTSLYDTRDLAAAEYRLKKYKPEKIIYVVGKEQELHLKQIFKTMELMGYPKDKFVHIGYGIVSLKGIKMSTRAGNIVALDDLLEKAVKKADGKKVIGIGAVIYNMLSHSNERNISFSWDRSLNLQGNSAPYTQYVYVRILGILRKVTKGKGEAFPEAKLFGAEFHPTPAETEVVKALAFYPEVIKKAQMKNSPHLIANYLNNLSQKFNRFYEVDPILKAGKETKMRRLLLVKATGQVIKNGLSLLGIKTPNKM